jgi:hypothetical protein
MCPMQKDISTAVTNIVTQQEAAHTLLRERMVESERQQQEQCDQSISTLHLR